MRVNLKLLMVAIAALAMSGLMAGKAYAACDHSHTKIIHDDATCLEVDYRTHTFNESWVEVKNLCSGHGTVVAEADISSMADWTFHLTDGNKQRKTGHIWIDSVNCCWDAGDLCFKNEVRPNSWNYIRFKSGGEYGHQLVQTAKQKCAFCERYADAFYCEETFDDSICESGEDGDIGGVSLGNCKDAWNASSAADSCTLTGRTTNANGCVFHADCEGRSGSSASGAVSVADAYHLHNCSGNLKVGEC